MGGQSLLWFGIGGGAALFALSLLRQRYVTKEQRAVRSRGGFTLFAVMMLLFAAGAILAGIVSVQ